MSPKNRKTDMGRSLENLRLELDDVLDLLLVDMVYTDAEDVFGCINP